MTVLGPVQLAGVRVGGVVTALGPFLSDQKDEKCKADHYSKLTSFFFVVKLSVPPIWIYTPSDAQLSPLLFGIFKSVC